MTKSIILLITSIYLNIAQSQEVISWKEQKIQFEFSEKITEKKQQDSFIEVGNKNYIVAIEAVNLSDESVTFLNDIKQAAYEIAEDMKVNSIKDGDSIPFIKNAYFVTGLTKNTETSTTPIVILVVIDKNKGLAYEITIDCYNNDLENGILIAKSFKFF